MKAQKAGKRNDAGGGHSGRRGMTAAAEMDMTEQPESRREAARPR